MEMGVAHPRLGADSAGLQFLITVVLWHDLISCISVDRIPRLPYVSWLTSSDLRMEDITGCRDWVMQAIGDIATLRDWKEKQKLTGQLSVLQLATKARHIEESLSDGLDTSEVRRAAPAIRRHQPVLKSH